MNYLEDYNEFYLWKKRLENTEKRTGKLLSSHKSERRIFFSQYDRILFQK